MANSFRIYKNNQQQSELLLYLCLMFCSRFPPVPSRYIGFMSTLSDVCPLTISQKSTQVWSIQASL